MATRAYAGHQFGHFMPQLGRWRAAAYGEVVDMVANATST
jgi:uncharacterized protein YdiU (UPF0061 family)